MIFEIRKSPGMVANNTVIWARLSVRRTTWYARVFSRPTLAHLTACCDDLTTFNMFATAFRDPQLDTIMDVDPEILARFVDSLKLHGEEHTQGVAMKKESCALILNVRAPACYFVP